MEKIQIKFEPLPNRNYFAREVALAYVLRAKKNDGKLVHAVFPSPRVLFTVWDILNVHEDDQWVSRLLDNCFEPIDYSDFKQEILRLNSPESNLFYRFLLDAEVEAGLKTNHVATLERSLTSELLSRDVLLMKNVWDRNDTSATIWQLSNITGVFNYRWFKYFLHYIGLLDRRCKRPPSKYQSYPNQFVGYRFPECTLISLRRFDNYLHERTKEDHYIDAIGEYFNEHVPLVILDEGIDYVVEQLKAKAGIWYQYVQCSAEMSPHKERHLKKIEQRAEALDVDAVKASVRRV